MKKTGYMRVIDELVRMSHFGRPEIAKEVERHLQDELSEIKCSKCDYPLTHQEKETCIDDYAGVLCDLCADIERG